MKKIILNISSIVIIVALGSCSKTIEDAYPNPNALVRQPIETLLPHIIQNMAVSASTQGSLYGSQNDGLYIGRYIQNWTTTTSANQFDQMSQATLRTTAAASDIGGSHFAMHYYGMGENLNKVIEWGIEEKKWDYVGVAHAIRAWSWLTVTDMHGEIIVSQAFQKDRLVFLYDAQEVAYEEVKKHVRLAIQYLSMTGDNVSPANLAIGAQWHSYKGDTEKWKKFAYSVMARVFHRTTNKPNYQADSVIHYANLGINENADNAYVLFEGTTNNKMSFYGPTRNNLGSLRQTKFIADLESGANTAFSGVADPRAWYIIRTNRNNTFKGYVIGQGGTGVLVGDSAYNLIGGSHTSTAGTLDSARYVFRDAMPWPVITATEIHFMKAEAHYRNNNKTAARTEYIEGISKSFDMLSLEYSTNVPAARLITPAVKAAFLADPRVVPSEANLTLAHIMLQKYIAMYGYGLLETWVDMRRYHYIDTESATGLQVYRDFVFPTFYVDNLGKPIYRTRPRFNSEFLYNIDALNLLGANALNYHTKEMWHTQP